MKTKTLSRRNLGVAFALFAFAVFAGGLIIELIPQFFGASGRAELRHVGTAQAKEMISDPKGPIIIDVRTRQEFLSGGLPGAVNLENTAVKANIAAVVPGKDTPVLLYCRSGRRSSEAGSTLVRMGYQKVFNLNGGIIAWQRDGLAVKEGCRDTGAAGLPACAPDPGRAARQ